jgi:hypothetical protein
MYSPSNREWRHGDDHLWMLNSRLGHLRTKATLQIISAFPPQADGVKHGGEFRSVVAAGFCARMQFGFGALRDELRPGED